MLRPFLSFLCSCAFAFQILILVGCGGIASKTTTVSSASACGGSGSGYDNQNGAITGVWLQSPSPGENPSHVQVDAVAFGPAAVAKWVVCLDDQVAYQTSNVTSSISQGIDMSPGQ